jgi:3-oxoacyl-[acyl-carrier protein] reductase
MPRMKLEIQGRSALVMGASRGLGRAIAASLAAEGAAVTAVARNLQHLKSLAEASAAAGGRIEVVACDFSKLSDIEALEPKLRCSDILILNTGGPPPGGALEVSDETWSAQFTTMFLSAVRLARMAVPGMRERRYGRIIAIVSSGVIAPIANLVVSNALRLAIVGWAKTLAAEVAEAGITVNCLAPGRIATDRVAELDALRAQRERLPLDEVQRQSRTSIPTARYGEVEEFASIATFLASARASYMTGSVIRVDGGMLRSLY